MVHLMLYRSCHNWKSPDLYSIQLFLELARVGLNGLFAYYEGVSDDDGPTYFNLPPD